MALNGYLMYKKKKKIASFIKEYIVYLNDNHTDMMRDVGETGVLSVDRESELRTAVENFIRDYKTPVLQSY
jgi:F0F1-type ATP synthase alpha subunit